MTPPYSFFCEILDLRELRINCFSLVWIKAKLFVLKSCFTKKSFQSNSMNFLAMVTTILWIYIKACRVRKIFLYWDFISFYHIFIESIGIFERERLQVESSQARRRIRVRIPIILLMEVCILCGWLTFFPADIWIVIALHVL